MNIFFILTFYLANFCYQKQIDHFASSDDNLILDFDYESLDNFLQKYKYVLVYFNDAQTRQGKKNQAKFIDVADEMKQTQIVFVQVQTNHLNEEILIECKKKYPSKLNFFIYNFKKNFHHKINQEDLKDWLSNLYVSQVEIFDTIEKLQQEINFVYIDENWYEKNKTHIDILAKLIFPVKIFTKFPQEILDNLKIKNDNPLWLLQSYSSKVLKIDVNQDLQQKAKYILNNEFPNHMVANDNNYKVLFELKIPSAVYFTNNIKKDKRLTLIKQIAKKYKEYFLFTIVETRKKNFNVNFLKKILGVKKIPSLRILNMTDKVQRFKFHGKFKESLIDNFFDNYIHDNLRPFKLSQNLKYGETLFGIKKANYKMFRKMLKDEDNTYVIFVYGQNNKQLVRQLEELDIVQDILRKNKSLKFYCIDHDQNDLDGYYNNNLPFLFIADRLGKLHHYKDKFESFKMLSFINSKLPYLENSEPSFEFYSGEL